MQKGLKTDGTVTEKGQTSLDTLQAPPKKRLPMVHPLSLCEYANCFKTVLIEEVGLVDENPLTLHTFIF